MYYRNTPSGKKKIEGNEKYKQATSLVRFGTQKYRVPFSKQINRSTEIMLEP